MNPLNKTVERVTLSQREKEMLHWAAQGQTAAQTARQLGIAEVTVRFHLMQAMRKTGARNKVECVVKALLAGDVNYAQTEPLKRCG